MALIKLPEVRAITAKSKSSIYDGVKEGTFPAPIKIGKRAVAWDSRAVDNWIQSRLSAQAESIGG